MGSLENQIKSLSELDELIGFSTVTTTVTDSGAITESLSVPSMNIPAKVRYDNTNEAERRNQEKFTIEIKVWVRYDSSYTEFKQVYWRSEYYDIYAIEFTPRQRYMVIKARLTET